MLTVSAILGRAGAGRALLHEGATQASARGHPAAAAFATSNSASSTLPVKPKPLPPMQGMLQPVSSTLPVFPGLPKTVPLEGLPAPSMRRSVLPGSGLRVASQETYGQLCNFGVFVDAGSRVEGVGVRGERGATHLMELMAFKSTLAKSHADVHLQVAEMGGSTLAFSSRDLLMLNVEVLRESLGPAMELLAETLLRPKFDAAEVEEMKGVMGMLAEQQDPGALLREGLHAAAFGEASPMGQTHCCPPTGGFLEALTPASLAAYQKLHLAAPRMVLVGAGVDHDEFVALAAHHFKDLPALGQSAPGGGGGVGLHMKGGRRHYVGGKHVNPTAKLAVKGEFCHVALSWMSSWAEAPGDRTAICVLQNLLGGGNSFSAGGPGKGMYSRLYREVLNRHHDVETAEAHVEASGLVGIIGACQPKFAERLVYTMADQMARLAFAPIADEELSRAKNMLKCNVLTCLESHHMVFEDIGQQLIYDDTYINPVTVCGMIDNVTAQDLARVAQEALKLGPSLAAVGEHTASVPSIETVRGWFRQ